MAARPHPIVVVARRTQPSSRAQRLEPASPAPSWTSHRVSFIAPSSSSIITLPPPLHHTGTATPIFASRWKHHCSGTSETCCSQRELRCVVLAPHSSRWQQDVATVALQELEPATSASSSSLRCASIAPTSLPPARTNPPTSLLQIRAV